MPKSNDQDDTRQRLLHAAVIEMATKGWGGLRTRALAERANVNKALVHYHFGTMDNLRIATSAHVLKSTVNNAAVALMEAPTVAAGIRRFGAFLDAFDPNEPSSVVLMETMILVPRTPELAKLMVGVLTAYENALADRVQADIDAGVLPPDTDGPGLATALTALLDGFALHAYMRPDVDFAPAGEALATLLESVSAVRN
jgi:AcrR family transcriptional regulator